MEFLTVEEVAKTLRVSLPRAYALLDEAAIPHIRLSAKRIRIPKIQFEAWLAEQLVLQSERRDIRDLNAA